MSSSAPTISVIVPVYNAGDVLGDQLRGLSEQTYDRPWEVVIADNGSRDGSPDLARSWSDRFEMLRVIDASARRGAAAARNLGAAAARSPALAFTDADDVVDRGWLAALADALTRCEFVAGAREHERLNAGELNGWHSRSHETEIPVAMGFKPFAVSSSMAVSRAAFQAVGGFSEDLAHLGAAGDDVDLSWRLQLAGYEVSFEPRAIVHYRHRTSLRDVWRQHYFYGVAEPLLFKRFRSYGVPARSSVPLRAYARLLARAPDLAREARRGPWVRDVAYRWGRVVGSKREGVRYL